MWRRRLEVEGADAHQPVHAVLALEVAVGVRAAHGEGGALDPRLLARPGGRAAPPRSRAARAQRRYMRSSISAQSCDSVPPAPGWMARMAFFSSSAPESLSCSSSLLELGLQAVEEAVELGSSPRPPPAARARCASSLGVGAQPVQGLERAARCRGASGGSWRSWPGCPRTRAPASGGRSRTARARGRLPQRYPRRLASCSARVSIVAGRREAIMVGLLRAKYSATPRRAKKVERCRRDRPTIWVMAICAAEADEAQPRHDPGYKAIFSQRAMVEELLRGFVPGIGSNGSTSPPSKRSATASSPTTCASATATSSGACGSAGMETAGSTSTCCWSSSPPPTPSWPCGC